METEELVRSDMELWLDDFVPCPGAWRQGCGGDPTWNARRPCCGRSALLCSKCKELASQWWEERADELDRWSCFHCGTSPCPASVYTPA
jgi:hypothetical protein